MRVISITFTIFVFFVYLGRLAKRKSWPSTKFTCDVLEGCIFILVFLEAGWYLGEAYL